MAEALGATGRDSLAVQCLRYTLNSTPAERQPTVLLLRLSLALINSGDAKEATELLREAVRRDPEDHVTRYVLSRQKLSTGDKKGAKKELRRVADSITQAATLLAELES